VGTETILFLVLFLLEQAVVVVVVMHYQTDILQLRAVLEEALLLVEQHQAT